MKKFVVLLSVALMLLITPASANTTYSPIRGENADNDSLVAPRLAGIGQTAYQQKKVTSGANGVVFTKAITADRLVHFRMVDRDGDIAPWSDYMGPYSSRNTLPGNYKQQAGIHIKLQVQAKSIIYGTTVRGSWKSDN